MAKLRSFLVWHFPLAYGADTSLESLANFWNSLKRQLPKVRLDILSAFPSVKDFSEAGSSYKVLAYCKETVLDYTEYAYIYRCRDVVGVVGFFCSEAENAFAELRDRIPENKIEICALHRFESSVYVSDATRLPSAFELESYTNERLKTTDGIQIWRLRATDSDEMRFLIHVAPAIDKQKAFQTAIIGGHLSLAPFVEYQIHTAKLRHMEGVFEREYRSNDTNAPDSIQYTMSEARKIRQDVEKNVAKAPSDQISSNIARLYIEAGADKGMLGLQAGLKEILVTLDIAAKNQMMTRFIPASDNTIDFYAPDVERAALFRQAIENEISYLAVELERMKVTVSMCEAKIAALRQVEEHKNAYRTMVQASLVSGILLALSVNSGMQDYPPKEHPDVLLSQLRAAMVVSSGALGFALPVLALEKKDFPHRGAHRWAWALLLGGVTIQLFAWIDAIGARRITKVPFIWMWIWFIAVVFIVFFVQLTKNKER